MLRRQSYAVHLEELIGNLWEDIETDIFKLELLNIPKLMDIAEAEKILDLATLNISKMCQQHHLTEYSKELIDLHSNYILMYKTYLERFEDTRQKVQIHIPELKDFVNHCKQAFKAIKINHSLPTALNHFLFELFLQQLRYPNSSFLAAAALDICMAKANLLLPATTGAMTFTKAGLIDLLMTHEYPPDSVTQNLIAAQFNLRGTEGADKVVAYKEYKPNDKINLSAWHKYKTDERYRIYCKNLFSGIRKNPNYNLDPDTRVSAEIFFVTQLSQVKNLEQIVILLIIATPYLDHKKHHTSSWKEAFEKARNRGFELLKTTTQKLSQEDPKTAVDYCQRWRNHSLFAQPLLPRLFKRSTTTQDKIDKLSLSYKPH